VQADHATQIISRGRQDLDAGVSIFDPADGNLVDREFAALC